MFHILSLALEISVFIMNFLRGMKAANTTVLLRNRLGSLKVGKCERGLGKMFCFLGEDILVLKTS